MLGLIHQPHQFGHFVIDGIAARTIQNLDFAVGKIASQFFKHWHRRIKLVVHAEQKFVVRIILPAKTCEVFVRFRVQAANRLQITNGRAEIGFLRLIARNTGEKFYRTINCDQIINKWNGREDQNEILENRRNYRTSRISIPSRPELFWNMTSVAPIRPEERISKKGCSMARRPYSLQKDNTSRRVLHWGDSRTSSKL
jgi:hypothetical protein